MELLGVYCKQVLPLYISVILHNMFVTAYPYLVMRVGSRPSGLCEYNERANRKWQHVVVS